MGLARNAEELRQTGQVLIKNGYRCLDCHAPFVFGTKDDPSANVYTDAGVRELPITQICEKCYDDIFPQE